MGGQPSERDRQFDWDGQTVADGDSQGRQQQRVTEERCHADGYDGEASPLGDAKHARHQRLPPTPDEWQNGTGSRGESEGSCSPLGSPSGEGRSVSASDRQGWDTANSGYWPPDRSYRGEWPSELEPAVRRVADGMAPWVDRLRLTGNGVVPLAAAVAFLRLRDRLCTGGCE